VDVEVRGALLRVAPSWVVQGPLPLARFGAGRPAPGHLTRPAPAGPPAWGAAPPGPPPGAAPRVRWGGPRRGGAPRGPHGGGGRPALGAAPPACAGGTARRCPPWWRAVPPDTQGMGTVTARQGTVRPRPGDTVCVPARCWAVTVGVVRR